MVSGAEEDRPRERHEMPAHHNLEAYFDTYIAAAGIRDDSKGPPLPLGHWSRG
jgi:hypothetical protein